MTFPRVSQLLFVIWLIAGIYYDFLHRQKYTVLLGYFHQYHPEIYEKIKLKPVLGIFYLRGAHRAAMDFAANHEPINDPVAEEMLADYAQFCKPMKWFVILGIIMMALFLYTPF